ncbi:hypothetical protein [Terracidiphilus sp.]|uniref:hypothetical protein n=1 Tax=Terracidiphilus sp. TaxID=1964191 RepID=UPI003C27D4AA
MSSYDLSKLNLPAAKEQRAPQSSNSNISSAPASSSTGYDFSKLDLPEAIEIPQRTKDGKEATEKIHVRDFGKHVRAKVEDALSSSPEEAAKSLFWSIGTAQGASLMPAPVLKQFEELGLGFAASKNPKVFFSKNVVPFLNSLRPEKRRK